MIERCMKCGSKIEGGYCDCFSRTETEIPMPKVKPPLGVMPQKYWWDKVRGDRIIELNNAILRYLEANKEIPIEWIKERNELLTKI